MTELEFLQPSNSTQRHYLDEEVERLLHEERSRPWANTSAEEVVRFVAEGETADEVLRAVVRRVSIAQVTDEDVKNE